MHTLSDNKDKVGYHIFSARECMEKTKIMVVEDEFIVATYINKALLSFGYSVTSIATTAEEAIERFAQDKPDLVLMDIVLEGEMDGIEAAQYIKEKFNIPIIYLTAFTDEEKLERAKITEPYAYLTKPVDERELHACISMALYKRDLEVQMRGQNEYQLLFEDLLTSIICFDKEGNITLANKAARKKMGIDEDESIADKNIFKDFCTGDYKDDFEKEMIENGFVKDFNTRMKNTEGKILDIKVDAKTISLGAKDIIQVVFK